MLSVSGRIRWFPGILHFTNVAPGIGLRTIKIGEAIHLSELPT